MYVDATYLKAMKNENIASKHLYFQQQKVIHFRLQTTYNKHCSTK